MNRKEFDKLHELRMINTTAGYEMDEKRGRFNALASRHEDGTAPQAFSSFNLFQTPECIVDIMTEKAGSLVNKRILEPSAGLGRIYKGILKAGGEDITLIENDKDICGELYKMTEGTESSLLQGDFLSKKDLGLFDIILMNPPFKMGEDLKHILHAKSMLKDGGLLVSLCYDGLKQNKQLKPIADSWEVLPAGSFKESGTSAGVALLTIRTGI